MKRIDITGSVRYKLMDKLSIKPSVKEAVINNLHQNDICKIRDLCMITEEEALALFLNDEDLLSLARSYLVSVGLHFGMTEDVLTDYMDADFLEKEKQKKQEKDDNKKDKIKEEDVNSYVLVLKQDREEAKAKASKDLPIETLVKEMKKEFIDPIKHFFIFLLIISLPTFGAFYYIREAFKEQSLKTESSCRYKPISNSSQSQTFDLNKRIEEMEHNLDME